MSTVRAIRVEDIDEDAGKASGAYEVRRYAGETGIAFRCPCGCGREGYLPIRPQDIGPSWDMTGPDDAPTLTPSVLFTGGCRWHGYLTAGEWVSC